MKIFEFTLENNVLTQKGITKTSYCPGEVRFIVRKGIGYKSISSISSPDKFSFIIRDAKTGICYRSESLFNFIRYIDFQDVLEIIIRIFSKETFNRKQPSFIKVRMVLGYVTSPESYSPELAALYDEYIRKNTAKLFCYAKCYDNDKYDALVSHAFAVGKPSKAAILYALKHNDICKREAKHAELIEHFYRLYPKSSADITKLNISVEAFHRMKILKFNGSFGCELLFKDKIAMTEQYYSDENSDLCVKTVSVTDDVLQLVKEAEKKYGVFVYHIHKFCVNEILYAFFTVSKDESKWEYARNKTIDGLPECAVYGRGGFEYRELPVDTFSGLFYRGISFTFENGILTKDATGETPKLPGKVRLRLYTTGYSIGQVLYEASYSDVLKQIESLYCYIPDNDFDISKIMIRWLSKEAFTCEQSFSTKLRMVMGYVTAPELYSSELAALYDDYIKKNAASLLSDARCYDKYSALALHALALNPPI